MVKNVQKGYLQKWAADNLEERGRQRFVEAVEEELLNLNTGNFARYKLLLSDFKPNLRPKSRMNTAELDK